jgi:hypothetical protein
MPDETDVSEETRIDEEIARLREQLRTFEERIHGDLLRKPQPNINRINGIERRIRQIVLRIVELEREKIELRVAK